MNEFVIFIFSFMYQPSSEQINPNPAALYLPILTKFKLKMYTKKWSEFKINTSIMLYLFIVYLFSYLSNYLLIFLFNYLFLYFIIFLCDYLFIYKFLYFFIFELISLLVFIYLFLYSLLQSHYRVTASHPSSR